MENLEEKNVEVIDDILLPRDLSRIEADALFVRASTCTYDVCRQ